MKHYIVFCSGQEFHDADDVVVRVFDSEQEDPRSPDDGVMYTEMNLSDLIRKAMPNV
jgi:hypothetical protein